MTRIGDYVWHPDGSPFLIKDEADYKSAASCSMQQITVAGAFELAGHPKKDGELLYYGLEEDMWLLVEPSRDFYEFNGERWVRDKQHIASKRCIDLSRLPVSDCFDALPEPIRKSLEAGELK